MLSSASEELYSVSVERADLRATLDKMTALEQRLKGSVKSSSLVCPEGAEHGREYDGSR